MFENGYKGRKAAQMQNGNEWMSGSYISQQNYESY